MVKFKVIQIYNKDDIRLMTLVKDDYLKAHPEMDGARITRKFLIRQLINNHLGDEY